MIWIELWSLVATELGEGIVIGRSVSKETPNYDVRLFDGSTCTSYANSQSYPVVEEIILIDRHPVDHPLLPPGMRQFLLTQRPQPARKVTEEAQATDYRPELVLRNGAWVMMSDRADSTLNNA